MSGYATPTIQTPTNGAGPQRSSRTSVMRRRRVHSESAVTTASSSSDQRHILIGDMPEPSISDLLSSNVPSTINFGSFTRRMGNQWRRTPDSSSPPTPLTPQDRSTRAEPLSEVHRPTRDPPTHVAMAPFMLTVVREQESSHQRRPSIKQLISSVSSKLDPRKLSRRRPSETSVESDRTLVLPDQAVVDIQTPFGLAYDPDTQRFTGLEAWDTLFPNETRDPFAGLEVPAAPMEETSPLSPTQRHRALVQRITQKLESLASSTKSRLPRTIQLLITPVKARPLPREGAPVIGAPFAFVHKMGVTEDPQTGRLLGLPEEWQPPPARRTRYSSLSSLMPPSRGSRRSSMPSTPRNRSQSGVTSSSDEPRATQAASPSPKRSSTGRRRLTLSFSGPNNGACWVPVEPSSSSTERRPGVGSRSSSQDRPPPVPEKDSPHPSRVGQLDHRRPRVAGLLPQQSHTYRTPRRSDFPRKQPVYEPHQPVAESSRSRQPLNTPLDPKSFGQARYTPRSPHAPYGYL